MQNYKTQEHPRNNQGNVVENPGKTIAELREKQRNKNLINGVVITTMALAVVFTGTLLGATTAHNNHLKSELDDLRTRSQQTVTDDTYQPIDTTPTRYYQNNTVTTEEPVFTAPNQSQTPNDDDDEDLDYRMMFLPDLIPVAANPTEEPPAPAPEPEPVKLPHLYL